MPSREYPAAPMTAVGAVVLQQEQVLLVRRAKPPLQGEWSLPGGLVELGETLHQAVSREVLEETGLIIEPVSLLATFDKIDLDLEQKVQFHYVLIDFLCTVVSGTLQAASDASDVRWVPLRELQQPGAMNLPPATVDVIEKARRAWDFDVAPTQR